MKKTFITLLALAGVAMGAGETITLGSYYTVDGEKYSTVDNFHGKTEHEVGKLVLGDDAPSANYSDLTSGTDKTISFVSSGLHNFTGTPSTGDALQITTIQLSTPSNGWYLDAANEDIRYMTVTVGETVYDYKAFQVVDRGTGDDIVGTITYDFTDSATPITFNYGDTITLNFVSNTSGTKTSIPLFTNITGPAYETGWFASIKLNTVAVSATETPNIPEPATATLSLLALAGLCARRRRA